MGPFEIVHAFVKGHLEATFEIYREMAVSPDGAAEFESFEKAFIAAFLTIYPSLMITGTGIVVWLNVVTAKPLFRIGNLKYPEFGPTDRWSAPERLVWCVILSGFALFLTEGVIKFICVNVFIVLMSIYLFHGLAILLFFLNKFQVPRWIRVGVYFFFDDSTAFSCSFSSCRPFRPVGRFQKDP